MAHRVPLVPHPYCQGRARTDWDTERVTLFVYLVPPARQHTNPNRAIYLFAVVRHTATKTSWSDQQHGFGTVQARNGF